jgi:hypothetical protein
MGVGQAMSGLLERAGSLRSPLIRSDWYEYWYSELIERAGELYATDGFRAWDIAEHRGILEAIRAADAELAKRRMREHILAIGEHYRRVGRVSARAHLGLASARAGRCLRAASGGLPLGASGRLALASG